MAFTFIKAAHGRWRVVKARISEAARLGAPAVGLVKIGRPALERTVMPILDKALASSGTDSPGAVAFSYQPRLSRHTRPAASQSVYRAIHNRTARELKAHG